MKKTLYVHRIRKYLKSDDFIMLFIFRIFLDLGFFFNLKKQSTVMIVTNILLNPGVQSNDF